MNPPSETNKTVIQPGSFRDPSGFVFFYEGRLYRQVNKIYRKHYDALFSSGLYDRLVKMQLIIKHRETAAVPSPAPASCYRIIEPEPVPFISYPYEWCFSQLRDAALATLRVQMAALGHGLILKDASAYNIQFRSGRPVLIDTLSFEIYRAGEAWSAYRQFCQHFLAPLALMAYTDPRLNKLARIHIDGVPLDLASALLPRRTYLSFSLLTHLHLHAASQKRYARKTAAIKKRPLSPKALNALIANLQSAVRKLKRPNQPTEWGDYYENTNYSPAAQNEKKQIIASFLDEIRPQTVWDLGANTGYYSRLASARGAQTVAFDIDLRAVEANYRQMQDAREKNLLPLTLDLTNPSPALGWAHRERLSLKERGPADLVMALALVHHLAIANNLPFAAIARFFQELAPGLIIEFVPKDDSNAQKLLSARPDIFDRYTRPDFEAEFGRYYQIVKAEKIKNSGRILYLMTKK